MLLPQASNLPEITASASSNTNLSTNSVESIPVKADDPAKQHNSSFIEQKLSFKNWLLGLFTRSIKGSTLSSFRDMVDLATSESRSLCAYKPGEVLNVITLLDTGGQPQYIHLLPTININPTVTFVVHDLSKSLDDQVLVEYSQHGKHMFTPYHLSYSNRDMIKLLMSSANDTIEKSSLNIPTIPYLATTPAKGNRSYICLVGTHADKVSNKDIAIRDHTLSTLVSKTQCEAAVWQREDGCVLFTVDNTSAGNKSNEDPNADVIRTRIENLAAEKEIYDLPITWMLLELEIRRACFKENKSYIPFDECVTLARETGLMSSIEEISSVLLYHHLLGVLIYFKDVPGLCNFVIVDHQWWFDKLSSIICATFQQDSLNHHAVQRLKFQGLLSKTLLQHVEWNDDIKEEFFLALLLQLKIIAPMVTEKTKIEEEYFIPYVLPSYDPQNDILVQYGYLHGEPLMIQFHSGLLPRGLFCCLIVELLQHSPKGWHPHLSHKGIHHTFSNLITFSLPNGYSLSLLDKVSYLEIQVRHPEIVFHDPAHISVFNYLIYALTEVCIYLNFDYERLQYGFCVSVEKLKTILLFCQIFRRLFCILSAA